MVEDASGLNAVRAEVLMPPADWDPRDVKPIIVRKNDRPTVQASVGLCFFRWDFAVWDHGAEFS